MIREINTIIYNKYHINIIMYQELMNSTTVLQIIRENIITITMMLHTFCCILGCLVAIELLKNEDAYRILYLCLWLFSCCIPFVLQIIFIKNYPRCMMVAFFTRIFDAIVIALSLIYFITSLIKK